MIKSIALLLIGVVLCAGSLQAKQVTILTIGNSFAENALRYLEEIVASGGHEIDVVKANIGGASLERHWRYFQASKDNPNSLEAKRYDHGRKNIEEILKMKDYDYITIQQLSSSTINYETFMPYASDMYEIIKKFAPNAEVLIHQTWAYREDDKMFGGYMKDYTQEDMYHDLSANYKRLSKELGGLRIIPVGRAFQEARKSDEWNLQLDKEFDYANAKPPALPNDKQSLNRGWGWRKKDGRDDLFMDGHHAGPNGEYLAGLIWYALLYEEDPSTIKYKPEEVTAKDAEILRKIAGHFVFNVCAEQAKAAWLNQTIAQTEASVPTPKMRGGELNGWWESAHETRVAAVKANPDTPLVFVGDSITDLFDDRNYSSREEYEDVVAGKAVWDEYYEPRGAVNVGIAGDAIESVLWRLRNGVLDALANPKVFVMTIGHNNKQSTEVIASGMLALLKEMRTRCPKAKIIFIPHFPSNRSYWRNSKQIQAYNIAVETVKDDPMIVPLDLNALFLNEEGVLKDQAMIPDNVHPAEAGFRVWAEGMEPTLKKLLGE